MTRQSDAAALRPLADLDPLTIRLFRAIPRWRDERGNPLDESRKKTIRRALGKNIHILWPYIRLYHVGGPAMTIEDAVRALYPARSSESAPTYEQLLRALCFAGDGTKD